MKQGTDLPGCILRFAAASLLLLAGSTRGWAQEPAPQPAADSDAMASAIHELQEEVRELRAAVVDVRSEAAQYRAETAELRRELQAARNQPPEANAAQQPGSSTGFSASAAGAASVAPSGVAAGALDERVASLEESSQVVNSKVDDEYQTKIESASKYRVRLSGIVLMNVFSNRGVTDNQDFPGWADPTTPLDARGNLGATLRQSEIGLEVFGPHLAGARTTGDLQVDFAGGFPSTLNAVDHGLLRLRIASFRMDWARTSITAGQDNAFVSPLSPTSFASLAIPGFSYSGNLWAWIPQVRVEHRFELSEAQGITLQGGVMDNLTGEQPYDSVRRIPLAGERSSQPAYGVRFAWTHNIFGQPLTLGTAGYYSRQDWGFNRHVDGWAGMTDWEIPLATRLSLSGEFYRGRGVGGLSGGIGRSVLFNGDPNSPSTQIQGLNSVGGWAQFKVRASSRLEFNGGFGLDNPYAEDVRSYSANQTYFASLIANRSGLVNFIYRPRSNLLLSGEYRHLRTTDVENPSPTAEQVNLMIGILF